MLNDAKIRAAKPRDKAYKLTDSHRLYLLVKPGGSTLWKWSYSYDGKQKTLHFGVHPKVSLADARVSACPAPRLECDRERADRPLRARRTRCRARACHVGGISRRRPRVRAIPLDQQIMSEADRPERFVKLDEVCRRAGLGKTMIYGMIKEGRFPRPYKISPFAARWSELELIAWIDDVKDGFEGKKRKL